MTVTKYQLKNGLTVLLLPSNKAPVVSVQMWVRTGSADEAPAVSGISHFIEHLVFKGTRKYGVGEIASVIEGAGGELNAYTSFDQTVFYVTIASAEAPLALNVISEMMGHPTFDPEEIHREREVVIEEIKRGLDSPGRRSSQLMFSTFYRKHPYRRPVIGTDRIIRKVSPATLKSYFHDRYCAKNMFLVVAGDFDQSEMKENMQKEFGSWSGHSPRRVVRPREPKTTGVRIKVEKSPFQETHASISWRIPSVIHADVPALDALALILGQGDSSRLVRRLRIDDPIATSVGCSAFTPRNDGVFMLSMTLEGKDLARALEVAAEEIAQIRDLGPDPEELQKAVTCLASEQIYSMETVDGLSRSYGSMEFYLNDPKAFPKYLRRLEALTPEVIKKICAKYLKSETYVATALSPDEIPAARRQLRGFSRLLGKKTVAPKARPKNKRQKKIRFGSPHPSVQPPELIEKSLAGGGWLLIRKQKETPTVSLRVAFAGGMHLEPQGMDGLTELYSRTWGGGTQDFSETEMNHKLDAIAAGLGTFSGRNTVGASAEYISKFDSDMWPLLESTLLRPRWPKEVFEREREMLLRTVRSRQDHPTSLCIRALMRDLFDGHPYAKDPTGDVDSLSGLSMENIRKYDESCRTAGNFSMCVVGDVDPTEWIERAQKIADRLPKGPSKLQIVPHHPPQEGRRSRVNLDKEQAHLIVGYPALSLTDDRRWALSVMQAVLAGQGGRLFIELRDKKSLAYSVSPLRMEGLGTGYFGAYIGCSPEKVELAEQMMLEEFQKLVVTPIPEDELGRAKKFVSGRAVIDLQRKSAVCASLLFDRLYGNDPREGLHPEEKIAAVSAADVQELARDLFSRPSVVSIVGPAENDE